MMEVANLFSMEAGDYTTRTPELKGGMTELVGGFELRHDLRFLS